MHCVLFSTALGNILACCVISNFSYFPVIYQWVVASISCHSAGAQLLGAFWVLQDPHLGRLTLHQAAPAS